MTDPHHPHHPHRVRYLRDISGGDPSALAQAVRYYGELFGVSYARKLMEEAGVEVEPDPLRWMDEGKQ